MGQEALLKIANCNALRRRLYSIEFNMSSERTFNEESVMTALTGASLYPHATTDVGGTTTATTSIDTTSTTDTGSIGTTAVGTITSVAIFGDIIKCLALVKRSFKHRHVTTPLQPLSHDTSKEDSQPLNLYGMISEPVYSTFDMTLSASPPSLNNNEPVVIEEDEVNDTFDRSVGVDATSVDTSDTCTDADRMKIEQGWVEKEKKRREAKLAELRVRADQFLKRQSQL